jgi:steroid delta-isomerase-like uncharacterized protein
MAETRTKPPAKGKEGAKAARPRRSAKSRAVEEHARSYLEALAARDSDAMMSHWDPDGVEDLVSVGVLRGQPEIRGFFEELFAAMPDLEITVRRLVADDRHAVVEWRMTGTFTGGPWQGIEPTGGRIDMRGLDLLEIEDKRILSNTAYSDGAEIARQVGMLPAQDSGAERAMKGTFNAVTRVRKAVRERAAGG